VDRLGWLNQQQLIDAVAIGQMTPGPLFTTATFIGYLMGSQSAGGAVLPGIGAALLATLGIFLPSFVFVAISHPFIPKMRQSKWAGAFLDGVNAAAVGLMAAVTIELARAAFVDPITIALGLIAAVLLIRFNVNSVWLVLGGALIGAAVGFIR
jgi:chromate transporter